LFDLTQVLVQEGGVELVFSVVYGWDKSVLRCLIDDNNIHMIRYLIEECGVNRQYACNANAGRTMLHDACEFGRLKLVRYLIPPVANINHGPNDTDANVVALSNTADQIGTTPLHCAIVSNIDSWAKTRYFVEMAGANTKAIDANGNNAIELAGTKCNVPVLYFIGLFPRPLGDQSARASARARAPMIANHLLVGATVDCLNVATKTSYTTFYSRYSSTF
jgi:Ankyrin repeats (3 copies)